MNRRTWLGRTLAFSAGAFGTLALWRPGRIAISQGLGAAVESINPPPTAVELVKPKIDVNFEIMQIKNLLAKICDHLGIQVPESRPGPPLSKGELEYVIRSKRAELQRMSLARRASELDSRLRRGV